MNKQIFYLLVMFLAVSFSSTAQNLYIHLNDGTTNDYPVSDVRKITFSGADMNLIKNDGTTLTWAISDVRKYTYSTSVGVEHQDRDLSSNVLVYPNPSQGQFKVDYELEKQEAVNIALFDLGGKLIETLVSDNKPKGKYSFNVENGLLNEGVYLVKIQTGKKLEVKKIIITK